MNLHEVNNGIHKHRSRKRIGRGLGSGQGKTAGRGHKGQKSNPGYSQLPIFEGGTMPLVRRIPKRGFTNIFAPVVAAINVGDLERLFEPGSKVTREDLKSKGVLKSRFDVLKILGNGDITKRLIVSAHQFSKSARDKIVAAGGEAIELPGKVSVEQKKRK